MKETEHYPERFKLLKDLAKADLSFCLAKVYQNLEDKKNSEEFYLNECVNGYVECCGEEEAYNYTKVKYC